MTRKYAVLLVMFVALVGVLYYAFTLYVASHAPTKAIDFAGERLTYSLPDGYQAEMLAESSLVPVVAGMVSEDRYAYITISYKESTDVSDEAADRSGKAGAQQLIDGFSDPSLTDLDTANIKPRGLVKMGDAYCAKLSSRMVNPYTQKKNDVILYQCDRPHGLVIIRMLTPYIVGHAEEFNYFENNLKFESLSPDRESKPGGRVFY